jgi:hypothetical protein
MNSKPTDHENDLLCIGHNDAVVGNVITLILVHISSQMRNSIGMTGFHLMSFVQLKCDHFKDNLTVVLL